MIKSSLHHGLFLLNSQLQQKLSFHILHRNCYCTYFKSTQDDVQNATNFFFILLHVFGKCRETIQVRFQEPPTPPPQPTAPHVDLLCMELAYRHGTMDRPWLQRKRTDTLTTHRIFFSFSFFKQTPSPPPPPQKTKKYFAPVGCRMIAEGGLGCGVG